MKELIGDYDETVLKMLDIIASGKRIDYTLIENISFENKTDAEIDYYVAYAVDWFMVRHRYNRQKATNVLLNNLRYCVGSYDIEDRKLWRNYIDNYERRCK